MSEVKNGKQILDKFFENINEIPGVDKKLADKLKELYNFGKLTDTNIKNMLDKLIDEEVKNEDK